MRFQMYDVVRLKSEKNGLPRGTEGTVVMAYEHPTEGYSVEFPDLDLQVPILTLYPEDLEIVIRWEAIHDVSHGAPNAP